MLTIDIRTQNQYIQSHISGSIFVGVTGGDFKLWVKRIIPNTETKFQAVVEKSKINDSKKLLIELGYTNFTFIADKESFTEQVKCIMPDILLQDLQSHEILDVREKNEVEKTRLKYSINLPLSEIVGGATPDGDTPYYFHCVGGYRSVIAISILNRRSGISSDLININDGITAIINSPNFSTNFTE